MGNSMNKRILIAFCFLLSAFSSYSQQIPRFNPDTIRTIVIDSPVNIVSHKLRAQDFIDAVMADTVSFYTADAPGKYTIIAEGIDLQGSVGIKRASISVEKR
jgi:hypothetical protein